MDEMKRIAGSLSSSISGTEVACRCSYAPLIVSGFFGFLPVLGFQFVLLGLLLIAQAGGGHDDLAEKEVGSAKATRAAVLSKLGNWVEMVV